MFACVAGECARILGQDSTEGEGRTFADLAHKVRVRGLVAREHFRVFSPEKSGAQSKDLVDTHWVLTWKEVDGEKTVKARLADRGYQGPDLRFGNVDLPVARVADSPTCK